MSTAFNDLRAALETRLSGLVAYAIQYEGETKTPTVGTAYLRAHTLPAGTEGAGIGTSAPEEHKGIFQVSVFAPIGVGMGAALTIADAVATQFPRGLRLTSGTVGLICGSPSIGPALTEDAWLHLPVSIPYTAYS